MSKRFRAAVIGCGRIGSEFDRDHKRTYVATHAGAYSKVHAIDFVALCDPDEEKLKTALDRWQGPRGYRNYRDMFEHETIDIVSVCTPPATHYSIVKNLVKVQSLKAIFCEKPMAASLKQARAMIDLCYESGKLLQIDHQRRFDPLHQKLRALIHAKRLGDVQQVNFYYTAGIRNTGSHMFDLLAMFFGDAQWVSADFSAQQLDRTDDVNLDGMLKFKSGVMATFQACDVKKYLIFEMNILFDAGRIVLKHSGFDLDCFVVKNSQHFSGYQELFPSRQLLKTVYERRFMINAVKEIVECLNKGRLSVSCAEDGFKALQLIEASIQSANQKGCRITIE